DLDFVLRPRPVQRRAAGSRVCVLLESVLQLAAGAPGESAAGAVLRPRTPGPRDAGTAGAGPEDLLRRRHTGTAGSTAGADARRIGHTGCAARSGARGRNRKPAPLAHAARA